MSPDRLSITFSALADPTRRAILARLVSAEASVTELAEPFAMSLPAVSKHLKVLERAVLITRGRVARWWGPQGFVTTYCDMDVRPTITKCERSVWRNCPAAACSTKTTTATSSTPTHPMDEAAI